MPETAKKQLTEDEQDALWRYDRGLELTSTQKGRVTRALKKKGRKAANWRKYEQKRAKKRREQAKKLLKKVDALVKRAEKPEVPELDDLMELQMAIQDAALLHRPDDHDLESWLEAADDRITTGRVDRGDLDYHDVDYIVEDSEEHNLKEALFDLTSAWSDLRPWIAEVLTD